jgi:hypothetical protein
MRAIPRPFHLLAFLLVVSILPKDLTKERIVRDAENLGADAVLVTLVIGVEDKYLTYDPANVQRATRARLNWNWVNTYASEPITYTKTERVRLAASACGDTHTYCWVNQLPL